MKRIEIIPLALKKIEQRNVPRGWIEETLRDPDQVVAGYRGRRIWQKGYTAQGKAMLLRVVVDDEPDRFVVITAYLTSHIERYRR